MVSAARILVVEDEAIVAEDLRDLLDELRYEVAAVVPSGREAIAKAVELRPDLVLMGSSVNSVKGTAVPRAPSARRRSAH